MKYLHKKLIDLIANKIHKKMNKKYSLKFSNSHIL